MVDVVLVLVALAFFGLSLLYVRGCERIIRGDEIGAATAEPVGEAETSWQS
ncbi:potassium transporter Trk [Saccharopolyspora sp. K220]|uniref:potassium transporter Trk n=1 Tax=Saccharopolyspora soli TaxID=2926618 RepID=UPI001F5A3329|nr:potassium transporter Trk [Saccharopolyspora soli]MCI2418422.1 potassium transporter Trk [Saccharopolyspora soli]